jgi:hypothetical protein
MLRSFVSLLLLTFLLSTQGCLAAAVGYAGYAVGSSKKEAADKEAEAKHVQTYNAYKTEMEKVNLEREKAKLNRQAIMSYSEWKLANNIPTPAPKPGEIAEKK